MRRPFHPILFALYPVLALYSLNTALVPPNDVPMPLAITLGGTCIVWAVLALLLRSGARAAVGASLAVIALYADGHVWNVLRNLPYYRHQDFPQEGILLDWGFLFIVVLVVGCWKWKAQEQLTRAMNAFGIILLVFPVVSISMSWYAVWRGTAVQNASSGVSKLDTSIRPDIFYIILDGYGRSDAIKRVIGVSNEWFIQGLKDRGFYLPANARTNYCETELSLSSTLNMDYLQTLLPEVNPSLEDRQILDKLIDENEVSKYLKRIGYRYEAVTTGFPSVHPRSADLWLEDSTGLSLFEGVLLAETPLPVRDPTSFQSQFDSRRIVLRSAFQNVEKLSHGGTQPRFVFVHILAPHPPFVFDADGGAVRPRGMGYTIVDGNHYYQNGGTREEYSKGYAGQVTYISKLALAAVDQILKNSSKPPVIIVQGDHGSKLNLDQELVQKTDIDEVFPNLNAYYVPPKVREKLYDRITPVNSFRLMFNGLFGDRFSQLPDRSYYSGWSSPFRFIEVTKQIKPASEKR